MGWVTCSPGDGDGDGLWAKCTGLSQATADSRGLEDEDGCVFRRKKKGGVLTRPCLHVECGPGRDENPEPLLGPVRHLARHVWEGITRPDPRRSTGKKNLHQAWNGITGVAIATVGCCSSLRRLSWQPPSRRRQAGSSSVDQGFRRRRRLLLPRRPQSPRVPTDQLGYPRSVGGVPEGEAPPPLSPQNYPPLPPDQVPVIMFGRGSQTINLMKDAAVQRKSSPKISSAEKRKPSPKVDHSRASWNAGLEKALVDLLHEHNNECYRGRNGWSTEAWDKIVKLFHEKFPYARFTKVQIQDKDRELKREYRVLKEARKQSGAQWNEKLCRIEGDEAVWNNIIASHPKAKTFRNRSFPLFESLGELYDGQTVEGTLNFTSIAPCRVPVTQPYQGGITQPSSQIPVIQPSQGGITQPSSQVPITQPYQGAIIQPSSQVPVTQPYQGAITQPSSQVPVTQLCQGATTQRSQSDISQANYIGEETERGPFDSSGHAMDDEEEVRIVDQPTTSSSLNKREKRPATYRNKNPASSDKVESAGFKRKQDGKVVEMMGWFLELKEKQAEIESVQQKRARTNAHEDEFPISVCIAVVDSMEDLSDDEKVEASDVFKDPQNRAIFMTAKDSTRLKWLRKKIRTA